MTTAETTTEQTQEKRVSPLKGTTKVRAVAPHLMCIEQAAAIFPMSKRTFWNLRKSGKITAETVAGVTYIRLDSLEKYLGTETYQHRMTGWVYSNKEGWLQPSR